MRHTSITATKTILLDLIEDQAVGGKDFDTTPDTKSTILFGYKGMRLFAHLQANSSNVVFETLHDFYRTAIIKNNQL